MTHKIQFARRDQERPPGLLVQLLRGTILLGVWLLVGLAGLTVWSRFA